MRGWEGGSEGVLIGVLAVVGCGLAFAAGSCAGGGGGADGPMDQNNDRCEEVAAAVDRGEALDEEEAAIFEKPWCAAHMRHEREIAALEDQAELQTAREAAQP
jgi:hypothetical protein